MKFGGVGTAIAGRDPDEDVLGRRLRILDKDIEVAVVLEHSGVDQFEFALVAAAAAVFFHQPRVRKFGLRILLQGF